MNLVVVIALARSARRLLTRAAGHPAAAAAGGHRRGGALPGGLGAGRGPRFLRRARHRSEQHDPDRAARRSAGYLALSRPAPAIAAGSRQRRRPARPAAASRPAGTAARPRAGRPARLRPALGARRRGEHPGGPGRCGRRRSCSSGRRRWRGAGQPERRPDHRAGDRRERRAAELAAPAFALTDQDGQPVSLASLRGKVVLLTFLDPVCTADCPLIAQEFRAADLMLGAAARTSSWSPSSPTRSTARRLHPCLRPPGATAGAAQLAVPDRHRCAQLQQAWENYASRPRSCPPAA